MKTGTSTLMDNVLNKDNELNKSGNYAEEWDVSPPQKEKGTVKISPLYSQPEYVGCYCIGGEIGLKIYFVKRPKWLHKKLMKLCLGWEWIDN